VSKITCAIYTKSFRIFYRVAYISYAYISNFTYPANRKLRYSLQGQISVSIQCHFFLQFVRLLRVYFRFESLNVALVLQCRNNAIARCMIYVRVYPQVTHIRGYAYKSRRIRKSTLLSAWLLFMTRTRDSVFMEILNGNHSFTREPVMRYTKTTPPFCFYNPQSFYKYLMATILYRILHSVFLQPSL